MGWTWLVSLYACACDGASREGARDEAVASAVPGGSGTAETGGKPVASADGRTSCGRECSSIEVCRAGRCEPACPAGAVFVPETGPRGFTMGAGPRGSADQAHPVVLTRPFCVDATEVTVAAYRKCVQAGACTEPQLRDRNSNYRPELERDDHPLNMVNWKQANAYCESVGGSLPTEAQWEWAATRGDGRKYPWGNGPEPSCESGHADFTPGGSPKSDPAGDVGCHGGGSSPVGSHPEGAVRWPTGAIHDMAGNVWEWTRDCYLPYPSGPVTDPAPTEHPALAGSCYVYSLRGGGWNRSSAALRAASRAGSKWTYRVPGLGFRCVRNATD